jgi:hypothetical protein
VRLSPTWGDEGLATGDQHDVEGGAHPLLVALLAAALEHRLVSGQDRALEELDQGLAGVVGHPLCEGVDQPGGGLQGLAHRLDRHPAGDLAGGVAAHAVGDDEEPARRIDEDRVPRCAPGRRRRR